MNHDDMARLLPADRDLPAARKQILKEHLMTELRRADSQPGTHRTKRPRRTVLVAGAVLTAAAVAIATAAQLLAKIADAAARQPAPVVRDSDFTYIRSEVAYEVDSISNGHETSS